MSAAVLMAVGPGDREVERADDVLESVLHHEPGIDAVLLVDDAPDERDLGAALGRGRPAVAVTPNPRAGEGLGLWGGLAAGMLHGYGWLQREVGPDLVVKLDTDALVIAPFVDRVGAVLEDPSVGMAGTFDRHCGGAPRDVDRWDFRVRRRRFPVRPFREDHQASGRLRMRHTLWGDAATIRRRIATARRQGYGYGEHCLGGAYAVPGRFLDRVAERGWFGDWPAWVPLDIGEDVCIGVYVGAVGLSCRNANQRGEPFGVEYRDLPLPPPELRDAGYAVVHSIKDQDGWTEDEIRAHFARQRA
ncbi:MAG: hypothetical protein ACJ739_15925 [Acidimicrobiales bacterium]